MTTYDLEDIGNNATSIEALQREVSDACHDIEYLSKGCELLETQSEEHNVALNGEPHGSTGLLYDVRTLGKQCKEFRTKTYNTFENWSASNKDAHRKLDRRIEALEKGPTIPTIPASIEHRREDLMAICARYGFVCDQHPDGRILITHAVEDPDKIPEMVHQGRTPLAQMQCTIDALRADLDRSNEKRERYQRQEDAWKEEIAKAAEKLKRWDRPVKTDIVNLSIEEAGNVIDDNLRELGDLKETVGELRSELKVSNGAQCHDLRQRVRLAIGHLEPLMKQIFGDAEKRPTEINMMAGMAIAHIEVETASPDKDELLRLIRVFEDTIVGGALFSQRKILRELALWFEHGSPELAKLGDYRGDVMLIDPTQ